MFKSDDEIPMPWGVLPRHSEIHFTDGKPLYVILGKFTNIQGIEVPKGTVMSLKSDLSIEEIPILSSDLTALQLSSSPTCEIDLNQDSQTDLALLVESQKAKQLFALIKTAQGYQSHLLKTTSMGATMACNLGKSVQQSSTGHTKDPLIKVPRAFIQLSEPKTPSIFFYWNRGKFEEVRTFE